MNRLGFLLRNYNRIPLGLSNSAPCSSLASTSSGNVNGDLGRFASTSSSPQVAGKNEFKVNFIREGKVYEAFGKTGDTLLDMIINNDLDFDGFGACEGTLACSTCHVVLPQAEYDRISNKPCDEELDMLDLAYDLTKTSRLGCQIQMSEDLNGIEVIIPATRHDARS